MNVTNERVLRFTKACPNIEEITLYGATLLTKLCIISIIQCRPRIRLLCITGTLDSEGSVDTGLLFNHMNRWGDKVQQAFGPLRHLKLTHQMDSTETCWNTVAKLAPKLHITMSTTLPTSGLRRRTVFWHEYQMNAIDEMKEKGISTANYLRKHKLLNREMLITDSLMSTSTSTRNSKSHTPMLAHAFVTSGVSATGTRMPRTDRIWKTSICKTSIMLPHTTKRGRKDDMKKKRAMRDELAKFDEEEEKSEEDRILKIDPWSANYVPYSYFTAFRKYARMTHQCLFGYHPWTQT